ncbi:MAG: hypothetical protein DRQ10_04675 [Candidatus Hydrothermota bacterium]|nr:MAG: hypothetical protein DRQ10_04675 [Candidatus Hydrothermae bacterium]
MAVSSPVSAAKAKLGYAIESSFGDGASDYTLAFGVSQAITTFGINNNMQPIYTLGSRKPIAIKELQFVGNLSVQFNPAIDGTSQTSERQSLEWLRAVIDDTITTTGSGPYIHEVSVQDQGKLASLGIAFAVDNRGYEAKGWTASDITIETRPPNILQLTLNGQFRELNTVSSPSWNLPTHISNAQPFTFAEATVDFGGDSTYPIRSCRIRLNNNLRREYLLADRHIGYYYPQRANIDARLDFVYSVAKDMIQSALNLSDLDYIELRFEQDGGDKFMAFKIEDLRFNEASLTGLTPVNLVVEGLVLVGKSLTVSWSGGATS